MRGRGLGLLALALYALALAALTVELARWSARKEVRRRGKLHTPDFGNWRRGDEF